MDEKEFTAQLATIIPAYQSSQSVHQRLANITLVAVLGPTSVGKTTLMDSSGLPMIVSDVTRMARPGEVHGVDNYFRRDFESILAEIRNGEFVQIATGSEGDFKGTKISRYPESGLATMAITTAALPSFYKLGFKRVIPVFVIPPSFDEWRRRLQGRRSQEDAELFMNRMREAKQSFSAALQDSDMQFVINDYVEQAKQDFRSVYEGSYTIEQSQRARVIAMSIAEQLHSL